MRKMSAKEGGQLSDWNLSRECFHAKEGMVMEKRLYTGGLSK
jgi:hypothetical protein